MDKNTIIQESRLIETKAQLLALLNQIKREMLERNGLGNKYSPFTIRHINYYCNPNHTFHRYTNFKLRKKTGGTRQISVPRNKSFMTLLRCVNEMLKAIYIPSDYAMGFAEGRSVVTNANIHKGQNYIFNLDLKDFFPSIRQARVWKRLQLEPICLKRSIANVVAGICSMKIKTVDGTIQYVLPQGAPTSPILTNMVCDKLDRRLAGLAKRFGLHYSRYADDITFSSMHNVYQNDSPFQRELHRIIEDQGFVINPEKTRLQKKGARQEVTGIIVSNKLNVSQKYVRNIRNILYIWDRYGFDCAYNKFLPRYKAEKGHVRKGDSDMLKILGGKLQYLNMVKGKEDTTYLHLKCKFDKLVHELYGNNKTNKNGITFLETTTILRFEQKNHTIIVFGVSKQMKNNKMSQISPQYENSVLNTTFSHRYATFTLAGEQRIASVNKSLSTEELEKKELLSISHCQDCMGNNFWMIHKSDKILIPPSSLIDIMELNKELDSLLV